MATILFFYGSDTYRSHQKLSALTKRYLDASLGETNLARLDGETVTFTEIVRQIQALPFLAKTRLVVLSNVLLGGRKELLEALPDYLARIPETTVVVFFETGQPDRRTRLFKALVRPAQSECFDNLAGGPLRQWLVRAATDRDLDLSPGILNQLIVRVGADLWRMTNELDKLAAFSNFQPCAIQQTDFDDLVYYRPENDVFALLQAISQQLADQALSILQTLLDQGETELSIMAMIVYEQRVILMIREAIDDGITSIPALVKSLGLAPFVVQKHLSLTKRYPVPFLLQRHQRILDYDLAIKTGQLESRLGLEFLIIELCQKQIPSAQSRGGIV